MKTELSREDQEKHVYLVFNGWEYMRPIFAPDCNYYIYSAPYETDSMLFGLHAAFRCQQKKDNGEDCSGE